MIAISKHSDIPGWGDFHHCYRQLLAQLPDNATILEVGAGFGRGTWTFLDCMRQDMTLSVVDSFKNNSLTLLTHAFKTGSDISLNSKNLELFKDMSLYLTQKEIFLKNIAMHEQCSKLKKVHAISSEMYIGFKCPATFDLVFLDGSHEYDAVGRELDYFKDSTLLTGHDYDNEDCDGVKRAVDDFMLKNPNKTIAFYPQEDVYVIHDKEFKLCKTSEPLEYTS